MKNFTKQNFKQFTSRLSARWLIMALMMLVGTSSAWADPNWACSGASTWNGSSNSSYYVDSGCSFMSGNTSINDKDFGTLGSTFGIDFIVLINDNSKTFYGGTLNYKVDDAASFTQVKLTKDGDYDGNGKYKYYLDIIGLKLAGGKHTITFYLTVPKSTSSSASASDWYISNGGSNYKFTFTIPTPSYNVKKSESGTTGGTVKVGSTTLTTSNKSMTSGIYDLSITAPTGYKVTAVSVSGGSLSTEGTTGSSTYTGKVNVSAATTISVTYAKLTYTITYNANGGSGAPDSQTKTHGTTLTLSSTKPTLAGYDFVNWNTKADGTGSSYASGGTYTSNAAATLYAQWELACAVPEKPTVSVINHTTKCNTITKGKVQITNYESDCEYYMGNNTSTSAVSVEDGKAYIYFELTSSSSYTIRAKRVCGSTKSEYSASSASFTVNYTDNTPTISSFTVTGSPICSGEKATLTANVTTTKGEIVSYSWSPSNGTKNDNKYTTLALTQNTPYLGQVKLVYEGCEKTFSATSYTVVVNTAPAKPTITSDKTKVVGSEKAKISVSNPDNSLTYTLYKDGTATTQTGTSFDVAAGTYQVKATKSSNAANCKDSELSDKIVISSCIPNATLVSATYNQSTGKIDLSGNLTETCDKILYYGFLWKVKGDAWNTDNAISGTGNPSNKTNVNNTVYNQSWDDAVVGTTYVFTAYALDASSGNPSTYVWYYDETGIEVSKCIIVATPNVTSKAICLGEEATLTLDNKQNGVTYKLGNTDEIFTFGNTHTVKPEKTTTYTITATSTNSCKADQKETATVEVEVYELPDAPSIKEETTVCPNTTFELPDLGEGKWYAQAEGGSAYASTTINGITATTYYYAEAVKYGCASATRTKYTVNVHTAPVAPAISLNPETVGQDKNSVLTISDATYSPSNTKYVLYKGSSEVGEMTSQTTNVSSSDVGSVKYTVKATHKECAALTSTSNEVTLTVQEAGAIIAALGDLKVDPQDPVDFVAMFVKNDGLADYTDQGATKVKGYTWQFSTDGGNRWTDCVSTATIGVTNGSDKCNNFRPSAVGKYRCKVTYDVGEQTSNVLTVTGDATTARTFKDVTMNIPVISVNTGSGNFPTCDGLSGTASKNADVMKEKISVDVKIFNTDGTVYYDRKARMNYRGSSSLNFVKKSYAFCTGKEKTKNDKGAVDTGKENLFDLSNGVKDKDWVLYAAAADPSIMRNRLMFDTFRDMTGGWSVNSMYVELVVNGEYKGVYVLMDKITANMGDEEKNIGGRVKVEWKLDKQGNTTQEGFIVKFDKTDIADRYENTSGDQKTFKSTYSGHDGFTTYDTQIDQRFEIEYPEKEDIEEEDLDNNKGAGDWSVVFNAIKDKFNKFEKELKDGNFSEVQKIIDYQSWADWFIITEFGKNIDGYRASNLFVYDGSKPNAKIEARPLWDQELSFNNTCPNYYASYGAGSATGFIVENSEGFNNDASTPFWFTGKYKGGRGTYNGSDQTFKGLLDDPCFVAVVKARWEKHKANALSKTSLNAKLTSYTDEMGAAKDREATFWSTRSRQTCQCSFGGTTGYENIDFDTSKGTISSWIENRPAGLTKAIEDLKGLELTISLTVTPEGGVTTPWEAVMVQVNNPSGYDYDFEYTTNSLDQVEGVIIQESNDKYTYRIPRPSAWGTGDGTRAAIEYGIEATLNVAEEGNQCGSEIGEKLTKATATITLKDEENDNCAELTD